VCAPFFVSGFRQKGTNYEIEFTQRRGYLMEQIHSFRDEYAFSEQFLSL